mgnify:CR=1 FL=1
MTCSEYWYVVAAALVLILLYLNRNKIWRSKNKEGADEVIKHPGYTGEDRHINSASKRIGHNILAFALCGGAAIVVANMFSGDDCNAAVSRAALGLVAAGAAGVVGGLIGFIFGIPRTQNASDIEAAENKGQGDPSSKKAAVVLSANTNLERVSDWLTALLLGATLVQLGEIPGWLHDLARFVTSTRPVETKIVPFAVVYFFGLGFLGVYLITRLYLTTALARTISLLGGASGIGEREIAINRLTAAADGDTAEMQHAITLFENARLSDKDKADPELNAALVKVLAEYIASGEADDAARRRTELQDAMTRAAEDPAVKGRLKQALEIKSLTTGDADLDTELAKIVA